MWDRAGWAMMLNEASKLRQHAAKLQADGAPSAEVKACRDQAKRIKQWCDETFPAPDLSDLVVQVRQPTRKRKRKA